MIEKWTIVTSGVGVGGEGAWEKDSIPWPRYTYGKIHQDVHLRLIHLYTLLYTCYTSIKIVD